MDQKTVYFPPVVAVLGHVDHGKTTLLDAIRKSDIAGREHGGITQKIGASSIEVLHDGQKRRITFIDTPGHEAFSKMRGRGAQAADIGILVVSAVDGVMPQTKESIKLLQKEAVPFIVALTKADLEDKNLERVKQQLVREQVLLEGYGGDVPVIEVSARTGLHLKELLDLILLVYEVQFQEGERHIGSSSEALKAIVIESKLDPKVGSRATVVVKEGMLRVKDEVSAEDIQGKVRALMNDLGQIVSSATVGDAVEVLGFTGVPAVGTIVTSKKEFLSVEKPVERKKSLDLAALLRGETHSLAVLLCTDTLGSLEAILASLPTGIKIIEAKTGEISEADVLLAKSVGGIILTFNTRIKPDVAKFALLEKVLVKNYTIIYELLDEVTQVMEGKMLAAAEQIFGTASLLASFPFEKTLVMGIKVLDGRVAKGDKIRLIRGEHVVGETTIVSLRQGKNPLSKIEKGSEAGVITSPLLDFRVGDVIISHS